MNNTELLLAVAKDCEEMIAPLSREFILEHDIDAGEVHALSRMIGTIIRGYVRASTPVQNAILIAGTTQEEDIEVRHIISAMFKQIARERVR